MTTQHLKTISVHKPVMVKEVVSHLITDRNGLYIDGTVGLGGHADALLNNLSNKGLLIGIDRDKKALDIAESVLSKFKSQCTFFNNSYAESDILLQDNGFKLANGILLDLGLSSAQLEDDRRGFTYRGDGILDMRFDQRFGITASDLLNNRSESEIANIIWEYGEERFSRKIAHNIKQASTMVTVHDLREAIRKSTPPNKRNRSFARVFQALRIAVNEELQQLKIFLEKFTKLLTIGGRIVIISYHSLEDRMVKIAFKKYKIEQQLAIITKKPLTPNLHEIENNSRAKSAKMRVGQKING